MKSTLMAALILFGILSMSMSVYSQATQDHLITNEKKEGKMDTTKHQEEKGRPEFPFQKKFQLIKGHKMAYVDTGKGDPIVFLHGNPTSSYVWRNIIPYVQGLGRCVAPDLIGMGDSEKLPDSKSYTFSLNEEYLDALFSSLGIKHNIIFVVHDWGSALAFNWSRKHPEAVKGIVYMEAIVRPRNWSEVPPVGQQIFRNLRSEKGEEMVLQQNSMIEFNLVRSVLRPLSKEELDNYRRPFMEPGEGRRVMLNWARQLPIEGEPANIVKIVSDYDEWLAHSRVPKLFIEAKPGTLSEEDKRVCMAWPNQVHITLTGHHHLQEDVPDEIGTAISVWIQSMK